MARRVKTIPTIIVNGVPMSCNGFSIDTTTKRLLLYYADEEIVEYKGVEVVDFSDAAIRLRVPPQLRTPQVFVVRVSA